jgi:hypothetical protein
VEAIQNMIHDAIEGHCRAARFHAQDREGEHD